MSQMESIRKMLQNHGRGVITDEELAASLFPMLSDANLKDFLVIVSPAVLQVLTRVALAAPRTEERWQEVIHILGGTVGHQTGDAARRSEADYRTRYRRGLEALRRHVETKLKDANISQSD